ncbi:hypothetical protein TNCV_5135991 [Trichonephila clavipes]|nr:hypothetical protein TNCV_5135991 [Trichonephila clavipes]
MWGCGSPVVKVSDHGRHVMSSSPVPRKTRRNKINAKTKLFVHNVINAYYEFNIDIALQRNAIAIGDEPRNLDIGQTTGITPEPNYHNNLKTLMSLQGVSSVAPELTGHKIVTLTS